MAVDAIQITLICGSVRPGNYTAKAVALVADELASTFPEIRTVMVDSSALDLPLPGRAGGETASLTRFKEAVSASTGIILATPEYHGSFSSVIKLCIEHLDFPSRLAGKPIALLGVASGAIGAVKALEHLRSVCAHVGGIVLPGPVSVAHVRRVFDQDGRCLDERLAQRIRGLARNLVDYIRQSICPREGMESMVRGATRKA